jgi:glycosyltransferase involved in cell wall biosynthesis
MNILYANANSIFDYTSGSSKSIRLILEKLAQLGHNVYAVCSCISDSEPGYNETLRIWKKSSNLDQFQYKFITRFNSNGINSSLIRTIDWQRNNLRSDEEENIYREAISVINECKINLIIGWGNLLLEESIFKEAQRKDIKICFYLVNPTYKGKNSFLLKNSDIIITDSKATHNYYKDELKCSCIVMPKFIDISKSMYKITPRSKIYTNCLFVNPSINKGLEPLLILSEYFSSNDIEISLICIDGRKQFEKNLNYLGHDIRSLPSNIRVVEGKKDVDELFKDASLLLLLSIWHESGSRLILESYSRGIPVIAFDVGGNKEFMENNKQDIFPRPIVYLDQNKQLRVQEWDPIAMADRILFLISNKEVYKSYSERIIHENNILNQNTDLQLALTELLKRIN